MKDLLTFIRESLINEGGNSVESASPIPGDKALPVAKEIISVISKKFNCKCAPLGSTGKKRKDQESGDIDIALELDWNKHSEVVDFVKTKLGNVKEFGNINNTLQVFNFGYEWEPGKIVQIDFMFVDDVDFAEFAYHSPDFTKNESKYKGMYASALLMAVTKIVPVDGEEDTEFEHWQYFFDQNKGLKAIKLSYEGKNGKRLKNPKKVEEKQITKNISKTVKLILGDKAEKEDCNSFESLVSYLSSDNFKYKDKYEDIKKNFLNDWQIKMKTSPELLKELEDFMNEKFNLK